MYEGTLVRLRARAPGDAPHTKRWYADPETMRWLLLPYGIQTYRVPTEPMTSERVTFTIDDLATGTPIGTAGLVEASFEHRRAMAFLVIGDAAFRGRGYGTDAMRALCRFGFDAMNLAKIELEVIEDNAAALRMYDRLGFVREVHRRHEVWVDGAWRDGYLMGLLREEFV